MWKAEQKFDDLHVVPVNDIVEHDLSEFCECEPEVETENPKTGEPYPNGRLIIHNSADQREADE